MYDLDRVVSIEHSGDTLPCHLYLDIPWTNMCLCLSLILRHTLHASCPVYLFVRVVKVIFSGAVEGRAVWPSDYQPVAWHEDADKIMFKLGLYHIKNKVGCTAVVTAGDGVVTLGVD